MAVPVRTYPNVVTRFLQMAFAGVVLVAIFTLQHVRSDDEKFMYHPPTLHFIAAASGLTVAGGLFGLSLTWYTCLVKYGRVVDLLGIMLNLAVGSVGACPLLRVKLLVATCSQSQVNKERLPDARRTERDVQWTRDP